MFILVYTYSCREGIGKAAKLNLGDFKASNGWLDCWKKKHNLRQINQAVSAVRLCIPGKSGYQRLYKDTVLMMFGIWMEVEFFGKHFLTKACRKSKAV